MDGIGQLRGFLEAVGEGRARGPLPAALGRIALRTLRGTPWEGNLAEAEDAVGAFLVKLCRATREGGAASAARLLELSDAGLLSALRHRIACAGAELSPTWDLMRQVRHHVRAHRDGSIPACAPVGVTRGGRLCGAMVGEAARWYRAQPGNEGASVRKCAAWVLSAYFPSDAGLEEAGEAAGDPTAATEAICAARSLRLRLGEGPMALLAERVAGRTLSELARDSRASIAGVHGRIGSAMARARSLLEEELPEGGGR